jgi:N-methylhydantoinase B/oxoprolinase/acetone carboxylase alpha subunit
VIRENSATMQPGNVYVLNDPYHGGTHLPDITVITPVYLDGGPTLSVAGPPQDASAPSGGSAVREATSVGAMFYVGSRGHHADIGGTTPGSMPPFSTRIEEEGVQIINVLLVDRGVLREAEMIALLQSGEYPSRNPQQTNNFNAPTAVCMTASILSNGRIHGAFGMAGGDSGQPGINRVVRLDVSVEDLGHIGQAEMLAGDVFEIHTPGGGGFGGV